MPAPSPADTLTVGVLGGMGPEATLDFFAKLLAANPGRRDQERLRVLIDNNPKVPNRNEAVAGTGPSPGPALATMAAGLERQGAHFLVMPCNAAHAFAADIEAAVSIPFVDMIEETVKGVRLAMPQLRTAGLLATTGTLDSGLYYRELGRYGIAALQPEGGSRERFMDLLYAIKRGETGEPVHAQMVDLAQELVTRGAEVILAACTEVPLVLRHSDLRVPLINSTDMLVAATVQIATGTRPLLRQTLD